MKILSSTPLVITVSCGVRINADGSKYCYHPADWGPRSEWLPKDRAPYGLDSPENGGRRIWADGEVVAYRGWGFLCREGQPVIRPDGFYISTTSLQHDGQYFDSAALPGWTLPKGFGADIGDLALIEYEGLKVWAQCCDRGGSSMEISPAAAKAVGIPSDARRGGVEKGVTLTVLPGSRKQYEMAILTWAQIQDLGELAARTAGLYGT